MDVIPLTLTISLLLSLTFIALFVREFTRPRRAGAEQESLMPLEADLVGFNGPANADTAAVPEAQVGAHHDHGHGAGEVCSQGKPGVACCNSCARRRERQAQKAAARAASATNTQA